MARMHSDGRGKSGSKKNKNPTADWVDYQENEVLQLVEKIRKNGASASEIGRKLRDQYGIPSVNLIANKSVQDILKEEDIGSDVPEDLLKLLEKAKRIRDHLEKQPKDQDAERRLELTEAKIRRIGKYYKKEGELPEDWKYRRDSIERLL